MPRRLTLAPHVAWLLDRQDGVLTMEQAAACGYTRGSVQHLLDCGRWRRILPGVLLTQDHPPTRRQRTFAAALWAGPSAAIDGACACIWHGIDVPDPVDRTVHLVVPYSSSVRSASYVRVRRSAVIVEGGRSAVARYVDAATALVVAARALTSESAVAALLSRPLQRGLVTVDDLVVAHTHGPPRGSALVSAVLEHLAAGVRSAGELSARRLFATSRVLPEPQWNVWLRLPDGGPLISPDALLLDAGMIIEVNGKRYHAWGTMFDDTEARQLRLTAAGLVVAPVTPRRLAVAGKEALRDIEAAYRLYAGRGMPSGVEIVQPTRRSA